MRTLTLFPGPVQGRTYSLYGDATTSDGYFDRVGELLDACLERWPDPESLVAALRAASGRTRMLRRLRTGSTEDSPVAFVVRTAAGALAPFTPGVEAHLRALPVWRRWAGALATTREQYYLHMVEIELTNRRRQDAFREAGTKLAFLPHCLRDHSRDCQAKPHGPDYVCRACSPNCNVHAVSRLLRRRRVRPYIWMNADLRALFRELRSRPGGLGVLGIACVPELVRGMRMCENAGIPVVGVPLDANRCARWMGELQETTVNLARLEVLIG